VSGRAARDQEFEDLVSLFGDRLFRTALLLAGDWQQAEDLVQITLAKLYARGRWHRLSHPQAYLRQMVLNEFISLRRRRSAGELTVESVPEHAYGHWQEADAADRVDLFRALDALSSTDRAVVVLRYWEDLSVAETALLIGVTQGAVRTRSGRALSRLRSLLADPIQENHHADASV
jgi:RNA polymerase sigma-70 factor (sigma-E family)